MSSPGDVVSEGEQLFKSCCRLIVGSVIAMALFLLLFVRQSYGDPENLRADEYSGRFGDLSDVYLSDNSDWWSEIAEQSDGNLQEKFLAPTARISSFSESAYEDIR